MRRFEDARWGTRGFAPRGRRLLAGLVAATAFLLGGLLPAARAAVLESIEVRPATLTLAPGATRDYDAIGHFSDGSTLDLTPAVEWSTGSSRHATASTEPGSLGRISARAPGQTEIRATLTHGTTRTRGTAQLTVDGGAIVEITTRPTSKSLEVGLTRTFSARARWAVGWEDKLSDGVVWSSSDPTIARIASQDAEGAVVEALRSGAVTITALHAASGRSNSDGATAVRARVERIAIEPARTVLGVGMLSHLAVRAFRADGSTSVVTDEVEWTLSRGDVIWLATEPGNEGAIRARADGEVRITARDPLRNLSTATAGDATVRVAGRLTELRVTPEPMRVTAGSARNAAAIGVLSSGELTGDLREEVAWSVTNPAIASVDSSSDERGRVTGLRAGTTTLRARDVWLGISSSAVDNLVVRGALQSLIVEPRDLTVPRGVRVPLRAYGVRSDDTRSNLTPLVEWTSSDPAVVAIDAAGVARATGAGTARIEARDPTSGLTSAVSGGGATVRVAGELLALRIDPSPLRTGVGATRKAVVYGTLSTGGESGDLREALDWRVTDPERARVGDGTGDLDRGEVLGLTAGWTTLVARDPGSGIESTATGNLWVQGEMRDVDIEAGNGAVLPQGVAIEFKARATYADGTTGNVTDKCRWSSDHPTVATVDDESPGRGSVVGLVLGRRTTIRVDCTGRLDAVEVMVVGDMRSLAVDPASYAGRAFRSKRFRAWATWTGGSEPTDASRQVAWLSTNPRVARLTGEDPGVVEFVGNGTAQIVATAASGHSAVAEVRVSGGLSEIAIVPERATMRGSSGRYLQVIGSLDDGHEINVTHSIELTSNDPTIVRPWPGEDRPALILTGNALGRATVKARHPSGLEAQATIDVTSLLESLSMRPASRTLPPGRSHRVLVLGRYADGLSTPVTPFVELRSSDPRVVTVSNEFEHPGRITAVGPGVARITAHEPVSGLESAGATVVEVR